MTLFLVAPGKALGLGGGKHLLYRPLGTGRAAAAGGSMLTGIAGLAGWWDASSYAGIVTASGVDGSRMEHRGRRRDGQIRQHTHVAAVLRRGQRHARRRRRRG